MPIENDEQLTAMLLLEMSEIINEVSDQLLEILKSKISEIIYDPFSPRVYDRQGNNGGFLGSWKNSSEASIYRNTISSTIESDPTSMTIDRENFIHGSVLNNGEYYSDIRESIADIIDRGLSGPLFDFANPPLWWKTPRPFWEEFIAELDSGKVEELIENSFRRRNIKFIKM